MSIISDLHNISNDKALSFNERLDRLLETGTTLLKLETGIVSSIRGDTYHVLSVHTPDAAITPGMRFPLADTYCADVVNSKTMVCYHNIESAPGASHPCFEKYSLKSYMASPIIVGGEFFGTVNFSSLVPKTKAFSSIEMDYLMLLATWIGSEYERHQAMETLKTQKQVLEERNMLLNQITALAGVGTWELNVITGTLQWSDTLKRMFDIDESRPITPRYVTSRIIDEKYRAKYVERFKNLLAGGENFSAEFQVETETGVRKWMNSCARPIMEDDKCIKIIGATVDVTRQYDDKAKLQQKTEIAESALKARSEFLATMSHEIRTPIHGVQGMLEALMTTPLNSRQLEFTNVAVKSAESLLNIVNDILDFSKIDSGNMPFDDEPTDIAIAITEQIPMFTRLAEKKRIALNADVSVLKGQLFSVDKLRLSQIIINLINNAIKFTEQGGVNVSATHKTISGCQSEVTIKVSDTGVGISEQQQKNIFSPFMQAEGSTQRRFGGTGLGLTIVKQIVDHYNGSVEVSSKKGKGATFEVRLVLDNLSTALDASNLHLSTLGSASNAIIADVPQTLKKHKVLIVEDNEINQLVIREQLRDIGLSADLAENGEEAVKFVQDAYETGDIYSIVLMDCHMPVMDGLEATKQIRLLEGDTKRVPIVAVTANVLADDKEKCLNSGMDDFISKPVGTDSLKKCIYRHINTAFSDRENGLKAPA